MNEPDAIANPAVEIPDPRYLAHLEWQVRTSVRRRERFARPIATLLARRILLLPAAFLAMGLGAGGLFAAQEYVRERAADLLGKQFQVRFEVARMRESAALEDVRELMRAVEQGLASPEDSYAAEERRLTLATEASLLGLDAIEVGYTGHEPDRRLCAPLVNGRDLVSERLQIELDQHRFRVSGTREREQLVQQRAAAGIASPTDVEAAHHLLLHLEDWERVLNRKLELRRQFLAAGLTAEAVELHRLREESLAAVADSERALAQSQTELARAEELHAAGYVGDHECKVARRRADEQTKELELARLELDLIGARLSGAR